MMSLVSFDQAFHACNCDECESRGRFADGYGAQPVESEAIKEAVEPRKRSDR